MKHSVPGIPRDLPANGQSEDRGSFMIVSNIYTTAAYFFHERAWPISSGAWSLTLRMRCWLSEPVHLVTANSTAH